MPRSRSCGRRANTAAISASVSVRPIPSMQAARAAVTPPSDTQAKRRGQRAPERAAARTQAGKAMVKARAAAAKRRSRGPRAGGARGAASSPPAPAEEEAQGASPASGRRRRRAVAALGVAPAAGVVSVAPVDPIPAADARALDAAIVEQSRDAQKRREGWGVRVGEEEDETTCSARAVAPCGRRSNGARCVRIMVVVGLCPQDNRIGRKGGKGLKGVRICAKLFRESIRRG